MNEQRMIVTRDVTPDECPWLRETVAAGTRVWTFTGHTYGAIATGQAVSINRGAYPFFELPNDALGCNE